MLETIEQISKEANAKTLLNSLDACIVTIMFYHGDDNSSLITGTWVLSKKDPHKQHMVIDTTSMR